MVARCYGYHVPWLLGVTVVRCYGYHVPWLQGELTVVKCYDCQVFLNQVYQSIECYDDNSR